LKFEIFPNPFVDYIEIKGMNVSGVKVKVFDINGKLIKDFDDINLPFKLKFKSLKSGIYFINIYDNKNNRKAKILLKNDN